MTAKDKAQELVTNFMGHCVREDGEQNLIAAIQCAMICVDEIINEASQYGMTGTSSVKYWQSVKAEIQN